MLPPIQTLSPTADGVISVQGVAAAGSVPAGAVLIGGKAVTTDLKLVVVYV